LPIDRFEIVCFETVKKLLIVGLHLENCGLSFRTTSSANGGVLYFDDLKWVWR